MNRINSQDLWEFVNGLGTKEKVKFKVYHDDNYVTEILWNGDMFEWEEGTFTSEAFFNPLYDFVEIIENNDKLEDMFEFKIGGLYFTTQQASQLIDNLTKMEKRLIGHINKIEERLDKK